MNATEIKSLKAALGRIKAKFEECPLPAIMRESAVDNGADNDEADQVQDQVKQVFMILFENVASEVSRSIAATTAVYTQRDQDQLLRSLGIGPCLQCEGTKRVAGLPCEKCA